MNSLLSYEVSRKYWQWRHVTILQRTPKNTVYFTAALECKKGVQESRESFSPLFPSKLHFLINGGQFADK